MLKRNQIIRKRYAEKARALHQKASICKNQSKQEQYRKAAEILVGYEKSMPIESTRQDRMQQQIKKTSQVSLSQTQKNEIDWKIF